MVGQQDHRLQRLGAALANAPQQVEAVAVGRSLDDDQGASLALIQFGEGLIAMAVFMHQGIGTHGQHQRLEQVTGPGIGVYDEYQGRHPNPLLLEESEAADDAAKRGLCQACHKKTALQEGGLGRTQANSAKHSPIMAKPRSSSSSLAVRGTRMRSTLP